MLTRKLVKEIARGKASIGTTVTKKVTTSSKRGKNVAVTSLEQLRLQSPGGPRSRSRTLRRITNAQLPTDLFLDLGLSHPDELPPTVATPAPRSTPSSTTTSTAKRLPAKSKSTANKKSAAKISSPADLDALPLPADLYLDLGLPSVDEIVTSSPSPAGGPASFSSSTLTSYDVLKSLVNPLLPTQLDGKSDSVVQTILGRVHSDLTDAEKNILFCIGALQSNSDLRAGMEKSEMSGNAYQHFVLKHRVVEPFLSMPAKDQLSAISRFFTALVKRYDAHPSVKGGVKEATWLAARSPVCDVDCIRYLLHREGVAISTTTAPTSTTTSVEDSTSELPSQFAFPDEASYQKAVAARDPLAVSPILAHRGLVFIQNSSSSAAPTPPPVTAQKIFERLAVQVGPLSSPANVSSAFSSLGDDLQADLEVAGSAMHQAPLPTICAQQTILSCLYQYYSSSDASTLPMTEWRSSSPKVLLEALLKKWRADVAASVVTSIGISRSHKTLEFFAQAVRELTDTPAGKKKAAATRTTPRKRAATPPKWLNTAEPAEELLATPGSIPMGTQQHVIASATVDDSAEVNAVLQDLSTKIPSLKKATPGSTAVPTESSTTKHTTLDVASEEKKKVVAEKPLWTNIPDQLKSVLLEYCEDPAKEICLNYHSDAHYEEVVHDAMLEPNDEGNTDTVIDELRVLETAPAVELQTGALLNAIRLVHAAEDAMVFDSDYSVLPSRTLPQHLTHRAAPTTPSDADSETAKKGPARQE